MDRLHLPPGGSQTLSVARADGGRKRRIVLQVLRRSILVRRRPVHWLLVIEGRLVDREGSGAGWIHDTHLTSLAERRFVRADQAPGLKVQDVGVCLAFGFCELYRGGGSDLVWSRAKPLGETRVEAEDLHEREYRTATRWLESVEQPGPGLDLEPR